jgi:tRNA-specific 2-thiouridylase
MCNQNLKFGRLISRADQLGAQFVATGHFARLDRSPDGARTLLKRGRDPRKDQSYFLFSLRQDQLARAMFPIGEKTKADTREVARHCQLKTADKEESMEICFVPDNDYGKFLQQAKLVQKHRGEIVNLQGQVLGGHDGIEFFTIGQRKGLGLSSPKPLYVIELDAARNRVVVGDDSALVRDEFVAQRCNWIAFEAPPPAFEATVKIRYNHPGAPATVTALPGGAPLPPARRRCFIRTTLSWEEGGSLVISDPGQAQRPLEVRYREDCHAFVFRGKASPKRHRGTGCLCSAQEQARLSHSKLLAGSLK